MNKNKQEREGDLLGNRRFHTKLTKKTLFSEILNQPELIEVLIESGMHCIGCPLSMQETIEQGAIAHGLNPDELIKKLNKKLNK